MQQKRLVIALLISTAILFLWTYLVPVKPPQPTTPAAQPSPSSTPSPANSPTPAPSGIVATNTPVNTAPHRVVSVKSPLYEAKIDSEGAAAVSWIIKKNKDSGL